MSNECNFLISKQIHTHTTQTHTHYMIIGISSFCMYIQIRFYLYGLLKRIQIGLTEGRRYSVTEGKLFLRTVTKDT